MTHTSRALRIPPLRPSTAQVAVYFGRIDEAEMIYRDIDRKDLAIDLRKRQGDWFKVMQLVQTGGGDDQLMVEATTKIGDYYAERFNWRKAAMYYQQAKDPEKMAECCKSSRAPQAEPA